VNNPLVGRKFQWTWQTGAPGAAFEVDFISHEIKTSRAIAGLEYEAIHTYDLAVVAPQVYMVSWLEESGTALTVVINLNEMKIYGSFSTTTPERLFLAGTIKEITAQSKAS
jgi:phenolic acid decarboxylase